MSNFLEKNEKTQIENIKLEIQNQNLKKEIQETNYNKNQDLSKIYILSKALLWKPKFSKIFLKYKIIKYLIKYERLLEFIKIIERENCLKLTINETSILKFMEENKR